MALIAHQAKVSQTLQTIIERPLSQTGDPQLDLPALVHADGETAHNRQDPLIGEQPQRRATRQQRFLRTREQCAGFPARRPA